MDAHLQPAVKEMVKLFRKHHLTYDQIHYVTKLARSELDIVKESKSKQEIKRLSRNNQLKLIRAAYQKSGKEGLLVKTLLMTGARVSEFVEIDVKDFYFEEELLVIRKGKGGKQRTMPITKELAQELKSHVGTIKIGYLFESNRHNKYTRRRVQQIVKEVAKEAGIEQSVHPHLLRHTVATFLLEQGMPLEQIQVFLGHEKLETTRIYAKNSSEQIREAFKKAMSQF